jgi:hypothetical protein
MRRIVARRSPALFVLFVLSARAVAQNPVPSPKDTVTLGVAPIVNRHDNTLESFNILRYFRGTGLYAGAQPINLRLVESVLETEFALSGSVTGTRSPLVESKDASQWGLRSIDTVTLALWRGGQRISTMTAACDTTVWGPPKGRSHPGDTRYRSLSPCLILLWPKLNAALRTQLQTGASSSATPPQLATASARADFGAPGYGGLRAGMPADSAISAAWPGQNLTFDWSKATVSQRFKTVEVRYHGRPISEAAWLPDSDLFAQCTDGKSVVSFFFAGGINARLFRVEVYLSEECTARDDIIRTLARRWGAELTATPTDSRFTIAGTNSTIVGLWYSNAVILNFSAADAPRHEGQTW